MEVELQAQMQQRGIIMIMMIKDDLNKALLILKYINRSLPDWADPYGDDGCCLWLTISNPLG